MTDATNSGPRTPGHRCRVQRPEAGGQIVHNEGHCRCRDHRAFCSIFRQLPRNRTNGETRAAISYTNRTPSIPRPESPPMTDPAEVVQIDDKQRAARLVEACQKIREQVGRIVVGQDEVIEQLLIAILARGHCLLEGVPGLAKTLMVRSLAQSMNLSFHRIQFTPDLMPADITGTDIIQENRETGHRDLVFEKGPIFTQMLLADEINRTPPKTQAALLGSHAGARSYGGWNHLPIGRAVLRAGDAEPD